VIDWGMLLFVAVGAELQLGDKCAAGEPHAKVIAIARTMRKKKERRPKYFMADLLSARKPGQRHWLPMSLLYSGFSRSSTSSACGIDLKSARQFATGN
jgi:hypothetical protein